MVPIIETNARAIASFLLLVSESNDGFLECMTSIDFLFRCGIMPSNKHFRHYQDKDEHPAHHTLLMLGTDGDGAWKASTRHGTLTAKGDHRDALSNRLPNQQSSSNLRSNVPYFLSWHEPNGGNMDPLDTCRARYDLKMLPLKVLRMTRDWSGFQNEGVVALCNFVRGIASAEEQSWTDEDHQHAALTASTWARWGEADKQARATAEQQKRRMQLI